MAALIVTFKLPRNPAHDPANKISGPCPINGSQCSDVTGQHHTVLITSEMSEQVVSDLQRRFPHITRVEAVA